MDKRGDGDTIKLIIAAALGLLVLFVMVGFFTGQIGKSGKIIDTNREPAQIAAERTGWCLPTLTQGKECAYPQSCADIATRLGGTGKTIAPGEKCNSLHTYSDTEGKPCCVSFS